MKLMGLGTKDNGQLKTHVHSSLTGLILIGRTWAGWLDWLMGVASRTKGAWEVAGMVGGGCWEGGLGLS